MPYYQSVGDFPVDVMMNQFNISNWDDNDDSYLYESIDLIQDYYDIMTDKIVIGHGLMVGNIARWKAAIH